MTLLMMMSYWKKIRRTNWMSKYLSLNYRRMTKNLPALNHPSFARIGSGTIRMKKLSLPVEPTEKMNFGRMTKMPRMPTKSIPIAPPAMMNCLKLTKTKIAPNKKRKRMTRKNRRQKRFGEEALEAPFLSRIHRQGKVCRCALLSRTIFLFRLSHPRARP